jgi:hypothetical protein
LKTQALKIALLTKDDWENDRKYHALEPYFGSAPARPLGKLPWIIRNKKRTLKAPKATNLFPEAPLGMDLANWLIDTMVAFTKAPDVFNRNPIGRLRGGRLATIGFYG